MDITSENTRRLYRRSQADFFEWCQKNQLDHPITHEKIAEYLELAWNCYGPSSTVLRTSALAKWYRENGYSFDTKAEPVRTILALVRSDIRFRTVPSH